MSKARIRYAEFLMQQQQKATIAQLVERYIAEMNGENGKPPVRVLGDSQTYSLRAMKLTSLGKIVAFELTVYDVIEYCRDRIAKVKPPTVSHDISDLSVVLKYAGSAWKDCKGLSDVAVLAAKPYLSKHQLIGKSKPRTRRPSDDEITRLLEYYETPPKHGKKRLIRMPDIIAFALVSTRRLGEICRITHGDIDWEKKTYWVRDLKHPTQKKGNDKEFALFPELAVIIKRQPRMSNDPKERVFPFNSKSCSASYTLAKNRLGIADLHFHDCRGEAISRWLLKGLTKDQVRKLLSGHETEKQIDQTYDRRDTSEIMAGVAHLMEQATEARAAS